MTVKTNLLRYAGRLGTKFVPAVLIAATAFTSIQGQDSPAKNRAADPAWCRQVERRLDSLQQQLQQFLSTQSKLVSEQLTAMVVEIATLRAENAEMRRVLTGQTQQLASLDDGLVPNETTGRPSERTGSLTSTVEDLLERRDKDSGATLAVTGFVDASSYGDHNARTSSFGLDQIEIDPD